MQRGIKLILVVGLLISAFSGLSYRAVFAQSGTSWDEYPDHIKERKMFKRYEWFYRQREMPDGTIPVQEYWNTRDREIARWGSETSRQLSWEPVGPSAIDITMHLPHWGMLGGRVRAVAVHPFDENTVYIGAAAGGIWRTTNGGESWIPIGDNLESLSFGAIAIDPDNPQIIYAGTGEARSSFGHNTFEGRGLFKSIDGGDNWIHITDGFGEQTHFAAMTVNPNDPSILFAALAFGRWPLGSPGNEGIWRSTDYGLTWIRVIDDNGYDIIYHPVIPDLVYAATSQGGVYLSTDNGENWIQRSNGLAPRSRIHITAGYDGSQTTLYATVYLNYTNTRAFKSINHGESWQEISAGANLGGSWADQGSYDLDIAVHPLNSDDVYLANVDLHHTTNGADFYPLRIPGGGASSWDSPMHVDYHQIVFAPSNPNYIYIGCDGGIHRSTDNGQTWEDRNNGVSVIQFYRMASHPTNPNIIFGGAQDNGSFRTLDGGLSPWHLVTMGDGMECFVDRVEPNWVYVSYQYGGLLRSSSEGDYGTFTSISIPGSPQGSAWVAPFFMHPTDNTTIYTARSRPFVSYDRGDTWTDLRPINAAGPISAMDQSPQNPNHLIFAAGQFIQYPEIRITSDHGATWSNNILGTGGLPGSGYVSRVVCHPTEENTMFVVFGTFMAGQKLFRTMDLGQTWQNMSGDLPNVPCSDFFIVPEMVLGWFIANDLGIYSSLNEGQSWVREAGMPYVPSIDFDYFSSQGTNLLRIATHGRGVYQAPLEFPAGQISGTVSDGQNPLPGVQIQAVGPYPGQAVTDSDGYYEIPLVLAGTYTLTANLFGYEPGTSEEFTIAEGDSLTIDFVLPLLPTGNLSGQVTDAYSGLPIDQAQIEFIEAPISPVYSNGQGEYGFNEIPIGVHTLFISSSNTLPVEVEVTILAGETTVEDIQLIPIYGFELDDAGFSGDVLWEWGEPQLSGGPESAYDGQLCWGTGLDYPYFGPLDTYLTTPIYQLDAPLPPYEFNFYHWYQTEFVWDGCHVQISTNQGASWELIDPVGDYPRQAVAALDTLAGYTGESDGWEFAQFELTEFAGQAVQLRFRLASWEGMAGYGWFIDNFVIIGIQNLTGIADRDRNLIDQKLPKYTLFQNYPNPFNPITTISFELTGPSELKLGIYNIGGQLVKSLIIDKTYKAGIHSVDWDGRDNRGQEVSSGIYLYRMEGEEFRVTKRMLLLK
ncbi:MAG: T9SS type A sorting domain-containing protein [Planctomycetes bacterium]|nr:T9SS type A sorting domain-containing protein [Planctomycetota bacterium]